MKDRLISVHGEYTELTDNEMQMYSTKRGKPADANMYIYENFDQFGDAISTYIRFFNISSLAGTRRNIWPSVFDLWSVFPVSRK